MGNDNNNTTRRRYIHGSETLCDVIRNNTNGLLDYFENTCIGTFRHNAPGRIPLFFVGLWYMFNRLQKELPVYKLKVLKILILDQ